MYHWLGVPGSTICLWAVFLVHFHTTLCVSTQCNSLSVCLCVCVCVRYFRLHSRYYFWFHFCVLLQSEKGIAMHSLCETSCPPRTVHCFQTTTIVIQICDLLYLEGNFKGIFAIQEMTTDKEVQFKLCWSWGCSDNDSLIRKLPVMHCSLIDEVSFVFVPHTYTLTSESMTWKI